MDRHEILFSSAILDTGSGWGKYRVEFELMSG